MNAYHDEFIDVTIRGHLYQVKKTGSGIPCLSIGIGTLTQRSLSPFFKQYFFLYLC
jgi:hypothetical protein